jgi:hypothetical protein
MIRFDSLVERHVGPMSASSNSFAENLWGLDINNNSMHKKCPQTADDRQSTVISCRLNNRFYSEKKRPVLASRARDL